MGDSERSASGNGGVSVTENGTPSLLVRAVYFVLVGWWASAIWLGVAWFLVVTIILMPLGIKMINYVPKVVSLKDRTLETTAVTDADGTVTVSQRGRDQHSLLVRAVYFVLVGWWLSGVWTGVAWAASVTIVGLPLAVWMYDRLPYVVSLYRY
ncbi:YccF domain-containing protein [Salarchaeum japonicum]|uniref:YccF domain-containing protein n=1 Tax=Salarchaeum japonicum TaxID=555573 RepID=A0AAV3T396_9EURY|nr:YccF domain-containing protein [Salarchaeum japonicum]